MLMPKVKHLVEKKEKKYSELNRTLAETSARLRLLNMKPNGASGALNSHRLAALTPLKLRRERLVLQLRLDKGACESKLLTFGPLERNRNLSEIHN